MFLSQDVMLGGVKNAHFMTSRSDGSSDDMSDVSLSRCREDMSGKGAELSSPSRERMSWRM